MLEGAAVMVCELVGAKMVAPVYGTSLQAWAAVLSITLAALTSGYYIGSVLVAKKEIEKSFRNTYLLAGIFLFTLPLIGSYLLFTTLEMSYFVGLFLSLIVLLFPPLCCLGMISPFIIQLISNQEGIAGSNAGKVYAISTFGGIVATALCAFWWIPFFGLRWTSIIMGSALILSIFFYKYKFDKKTKLIILLAFVTFSLNIKILFSQNKKGLLFAKEGILGQTRVLDQTLTLPTGTIKERILMVNNTWQSRVDMQSHHSISPYVNFLEGILHELKAQKTVSNSLLIGLGSGSIANFLLENQISCDAIEFDQNVITAAKKYFDLNPEVNTIREDGRYFINKSNKKYDLIIFDAFWGDNPPEHLLTKESFIQAKEKLNKSGSMITVFFGAHQNQEGLTNRMLYKTLKQVYPYVYAIPIVLDNTTFNNILYLSSLEPINLSKNNFKYTSPYTFDKMNTQLAYIPNIDTTEIEILSDNHSQLDFYLQKSSLEYRTYQMKEIQKMYQNNSLPLFY